MQDYLVSSLVGTSVLAGGAVAGLFRYQVGLVEVEPSKRSELEPAENDEVILDDLDDPDKAVFCGLKPDLEDVEDATKTEQKEKLYEIYQLIGEGAESFLLTEFRMLLAFIAIFGLLIFVVKGLAVSGNISKREAWTDAGLTLLCFVVGASASIMAGYIGMAMATYTNARATIGAERNLSSAFKIAYQGGGVMGFSLVAIGILTLFIMYLILGANYTNYLSDIKVRRRMMETLAAYGVGASCVALFARVGGGIYTKAADIGADLVGKLEAGIPEDDPRNPAVIADNVGDNVGDIAGMGADLFGSLAGSTCAAFVLVAEVEGWGWAARLFPLCMSSVGILSGALSTGIVYIYSVNEFEQISFALKMSEIVSTTISAAGLVGLSWILPAVTEFREHKVARWQLMLCALLGLFGGLAIGIITEYYTSSEYKPVQEVAQSCRTGAATNIIYGLALGYESTVIPVVIMAIIVWANSFMAGTLGVALGTLGVLTTLVTSLTIDAYGPICDNAGGIAEMAGLPEIVRDRTDALDAAGNTTAAIGKGFAIGSAALVAFALLGAFSRQVAGPAQFRDNLTPADRHGNKIGSEVRLLDPAVFPGILFGAMLPYFFSAMTMKSVGIAALSMVEEVREQFSRNPGILEGTVKPDYHSCIRIATEASLREMILPGLLVILSPLLSGFIFGTRFLTGVLGGALVSGVQMAISASNTGGAWDNAKKYIGAGQGDLGGKGSDAHNAAIIGDTVGDPLKDTSGPALNILIKLMGIISVVFASAMVAVEDTYSNDKPYGLIGRLVKSI